MNYRAVVAAAFMILLSYSVSHAGEPYAPVAKVPANVADDPAVQLAVLALKSVKVPDKKEVGVPPYPGAKIVYTTVESKDVYATLRLLSADDPSKVALFYKEKLTGWNSEEFSGTHNFWQGNKRESMMGRAPTVIISAADDADRGIMSDARTGIRIWYRAGM